MNINLHKPIDSLQQLKGHMEHKREFYSQVFRSLGCLKLWEARHSMVIDFIDQKQVLSMLDLGTSESTLLMKVQRGIQICRLAGLDIDDQVISQAIDNLMPQGIQNDFQYSRHYSQHVQLFKGSALIKYPQLKEAKFQLITLVEVIEHIEEQYLPSLNQNVFGYLRPKWVWLSTPNSEFNPLFKWQEPNRKFRHDDHKFEWTRKQFHEYVNAVCEKYHYKAEITGVGLAADDANLDKGFCTQIAIFQRLDDNDKMEPETASQMVSESKHQIQEPIVPLQLKHEHVNLCWKQNIDHLLNIAMRQLITVCDSKESLNWHQVTSILRQKTIIKKLKQHNSEWSFDYHLKSFVFEYCNNHPEAQIGCSKIGIRQLSPKPESEHSSIDFTMLDEEFEREMSEWKMFSREEQEMIEADKKAMEEPGVTIYEYDQNEPLFKRRSEKGKSIKSSKSKNSSSSGSNEASSSSESSSSKKSQKSENSWGSVELVEEKRKRRIRKRPIVRLRGKPEGYKSQGMDKEGEEVVNKSEK